MHCNVQVVLHATLNCIEMFLSLRHRSSIHFGSGPLLVAQTHEFHIAHQLLALVHQHLPCSAMYKWWGMLISTAVSSFSLTQPPIIDAIYFWAMVGGPDL
jgi:hypothetical protein